MNILGTGLSGLVGSRIRECLNDSFEFEDLSLERGVDITKKEELEQILSKSTAPWVFHFAAKTDVDGAESERMLGEQSSYWQVNVLATEHIVASCQRARKRLLYVSTDYVFDGTKDVYTEEDMPSPQGWYALTKYEGEKRVARLGSDGLIIRIANPYGARNEKKLDFVHRVLHTLSAGNSLCAPTDQKLVPTFIDDIASAIKMLVTNDASGVYHVVGSSNHSPFEAAEMIAKAFGYDASLVTQTSFSEYFAGRAPRPFHAILKNDKIAKFGIQMATFPEGLNAIRTV